jgi:arsenate reductase-like glutaredoxin family protein
LRGSVEIEEVNYAKTGLTEATVLDIVGKAGSVAAVLNTRHATAKDRGWVASPPSAAAFAKAVVADVNLLRRPILVDGDRVIVGFDREAYARLGKGQASRDRAATPKPAASAKPPKPAKRK